MSSLHSQPEKSKIVHDTSTCIIIRSIEAQRYSMYYVGIIVHVSYVYVYTAFTVCVQLCPTTLCMYLRTYYTTVHVHATCENKIVYLASDYTYTYSTCTRKRSGSLGNSKIDGLNLARPDEPDFRAGEKKVPRGRMPPSSARTSSFLADFFTRRSGVILARIDFF